MTTAVAETTETECGVNHESTSQWSSNWSIEVTRTFMEICLPVVVGAEALQEVGNVARDGDGEDESDAYPEGTVQVRVGPNFVEKETAALKSGYHRADASSDDVIGAHVEELLIELDLPYRVLFVLEQTLVHRMSLLKESVIGQQLKKSSQRSAETEPKRLINHSNSHSGCRCPPSLRGSRESW